jgi:ferredoxin
VSTHRVTFPGTAFAAVELPDQANLSSHLTVLNSPLLFGCRSGLCGTCLIEVEVVEVAGKSGGRLDPPDDAEREALALYAPNNERARLACQLRLGADLRIRKIRSA